MINKYSNHHYTYCTNESQTTLSLICLSWAQMLFFAFMIFLFGCIVGATF